MDIDLRSIIIPNAVAVTLLMILRYAGRARVSRDRKEDKLYMWLVYGVMIGSVMEALSFVIDGKVFFGSRALNYFINTYIFSTNVMLAFGLLVYVDLCLYGNPDRIRRHYMPQIVLLVIMVVANIVNYFVPISYYITPENVYERRVFSYAYYFVLVYYFISIFFLLRKYNKENGARGFISFGMFLVPVIIGTGLQFAFYGVSLAWLSSAIGLTGLFMMQQNEMAYIDPLVQLYNRQYMDHILAAWIGRNRSFVGAMLDIDKFKTINDTFGHAEGDMALKALSNILKMSRRGGEWIFRYAGDEFIVLLLSDDPHGLDAYMDEVNRRLDEFNAKKHQYMLSLSYGVCFFSDCSAGAVLKEMDNRMYAMKEQRTVETAVRRNQ